MKLKKYKLKDFKVLKGLDKTNDNRIAYILKTKDNIIEANFFWEKNNVEVRGLIWNKDLIKATFGIAYPFANRNNYGFIPEPEKIINSIITHLDRKEYVVI